MSSEPTSMHDVIVFATELADGKAPGVVPASPQTIEALLGQLPIAPPAIYLDYLRTMGDELGPFAFYQGQLRAHELLRWYRAVRDDPEIQLPTDAIVLAAMGVGADLVVLRPDLLASGTQRESPSFVVEDRWYDSDETAPLSPTLCQLLCASAYFDLRLRSARRLFTARVESRSSAADPIVAVAEATCKAARYPFRWRHQLYLALPAHTELLIDASNPQSALVHIYSRQAPARSIDVARALFSALEAAALTIRTLTEHPVL